jgi:hypothetical protein
VKKYCTELRRKGISFSERRKANGIGHILHRNCLLKLVVEEKNGRDGKTKKT